MFIKARAKKACQIAGIDPDRLNEWIAAGDYPCAPATIAGRARLFNNHDIVGLMVFARLMADGMAASKAGQIACRVNEIAAHSKDPFVLVSGSDAINCTSEQLKNYIINAPTDHVMIFKTRSMLSDVNDRLDEEACIVGEE